ncbi:hypothetical protein AK812_SmicGene44744 [Symbiodinium microadriaticum]|uniref:Uncharacterized protein n=1 Tax=Symbiodinium microadriaticum TaxID=2951 RepID=A0A1Q9BXQ2_SYMMI|nr:hypothetical protein AK812_SmicGene44744 [Symbiodinium microadriaticum]CAE7519423.1 unnamed protein product [Symbiodinium microadriaticum]CAE7819937.1 unnamed protein product [Symbiodinium sp. KB8]
MPPATRTLPAPAHALTEPQTDSASQEQECPSPAPTLVESSGSDATMLYADLEPPAHSEEVIGSGDWLTCGYTGVIFSRVSLPTQARSTANPDLAGVILVEDIELRCYASCSRKQGSHLLLTAHPACSLHWMSQALIDITVATAVAADMSIMSYWGDDITRPL